MRYPIQLRFKLLALASQISARDADGNELFYVHQKILKLKEDVSVYRDSTKTQQIFSIKADRVIDFSPLFTLYDPSNTSVATIKRQGMRSIWRTRYELTLYGQPFATVRESNPWTKVWDGLFGSIPFVGMFAGYVFHPKYILEDTRGQQLGLLEKKPAFFEGVFELNGDLLATADEKIQNYAALLLMVVVLLERARG